MRKELTLRNFLKDLGLRVSMAALAVGAFAGLAFVGDSMEIGLLQSPAGIFLVIAIILPLLLVVFRYLDWL
ncbi:MAG: hypothetical protein ABEK10_04840 [Candidatus Nanosalina sp.]